MSALNRAVDTMLATLDADQSRQWELKDLIEDTMTKTAWKSGAALRHTILALVSAGSLTGYQSRKTWRGIQRQRTKPTSSGGDSGPTNTSAEVAALAEEVSMLKSDLRWVKDRERQAQRDLVTAQAALAGQSSGLPSTPEPTAPTASTILEVHLHKADGEVQVTTGLYHEKFETICQLAQARMNVFIYGPTGVGKTHVCQQLAEVLGLRFAFISCTAGMSEAQLGGRLLPTGDAGKFEYSRSEFVACYEEGGVFLLDEIDAADPNVLLLVNAALANGKVAVPNRPTAPYAKRHPDFICVAAANTVGTGADRLYSGRNKLDAATLDRFQIGKVMMDYDERVEEQLCPDQPLRTRLTRYRRAVRDHRLERAVSTRFLKDAFKMKSQFKWSDNQIDTALFSGWRDDEVQKVKSFTD